MAEQVFRLPDLGEGLTEAEVVEWKVAVGDVVAVDQAVVEVETAKAAVEVPVPIAGTVTRLYGEAGTVVTVGEPLIAVAVDGSADAGSDEGGSGNVLVGYGTGPSRPAGRRRRAARRDDSRRNEAQRNEAHRADVRPSAGTPVPRGRPDAPRVISPMVRRLAREHGIDIATVPPTGPGGVVLRRDVEAAITAARPSAQQAEAQDGAVRVPLKGPLRAAAEKLSRSRREIPDASTWVDADATRLVELKESINKADPDARVGLLALFARICVAGLRRFPELNAYVDVEREEIVRLPHVHLGFAAQTGRGLVVPVVRDADRLTLAELSGKLRERTDAARDGRLAPADLTGGTFTLNNYGVFGVDGADPIINHPEAAMLGVGRIVERPWAFEGEVRLRRVVQLTCAFDHRVCDGAVAGGFLRFVADCVERPEVLVTHT
ncbi:2-oxo acid dehydrogenase subunit E2 [Actinomadura decatromicini]|uniref:Dihydrolipoamide acetyltransferase component of pyruvate dehydrogenase complex n=1 Tax=Actinomadura decatromicini TaxID=2604572 RepID=A0A5D3FGX9_9ACTN|nr:2-oxo acid dehydrogenase subunit E2 [Actinomadura decatromicini]